MKTLARKIAIVTGASKDIGAGIAKSLAEAGASVVVNYATDRLGAEAVVAQITEAGGRAVAVQPHVGKNEDVLASRDAVNSFSEDGGSIINIGSLGTKLNLPASVVYMAAKGAVESITLVLANELEPRKIRLNSVNPGLILTEGVVSSGLTPDIDFVAKMIEKTPLGSTGTPQDVGYLVAFLTSDAAS